MTRTNRRKLILGASGGLAATLLGGGPMLAWSTDESVVTETRQGKVRGIRTAQAVLATYKASRPEASPADLYCAIRTSRFSGTGSTVIAERKTAQGGAPAYQYIFSYRLEAKLPGSARPIGAMHGIDIPFKFDNVEHTSMNGTGNVAGARPERIKAGRNMSEM